MPKRIYEGMQASIFMNAFSANSWKWNISNIIKTLKNIRNPLWLTIFGLIKI
jgi:hypothetical protein